jgi:hypothetical protein
MLKGEIQMSEITPLILFAAMAPAPTDSEIEMAHKLDKMRNPYNDCYKPPLRSRSEVIADYKVGFAKLMLERIGNATSI